MASFFEKLKKLLGGRRRSGLEGVCGGVAMAMVAAGFMWAVTRVELSGRGSPDTGTSYQERAESGWARSEPNPMRLRVQTLIGDIMAGLSVLVFIFVLLIQRRLDKVSAAGAIGGRANADAVAAGANDEPRLLRLSTERRPYWRPETK